MFLVCVCHPLCLTAYVLYVCCVIWALLPAIYLGWFVPSLSNIRLQFGQVQRCAVSADLEIFIHRNREASTTRSSKKIQQKEKVNLKIPVELGIAVDVKK